MIFLESLGFSKEEIAKFKDSVADVMLETLDGNKKLVKANLQYLIDLGGKNVHEIFFN